MSRTTVSRRIMSRLSTFLAGKKSGHESPWLVGATGLGAGANSGLHGLLERHTLPVAHQRLLQPDRARACGQDGGHPLLDSRIEACGLDQLLQETATVGLGGIDVIAGEDPLA